MNHVKALKWLSVILVIAIMITAIGCGKKEAQVPTPTPTAAPTATATPYEPTGETGILSSVTGDVQVLRQGASAWMVATSGMKIGTGDSLKTGGDGSVLITFFDGSVMEMNASTEISVEELSLASGGSTTVHINQVIGNTLNRVQNLVDSSSTYEVETPSVSTVVRGTIVVIQVDKNGRTIISVVDEGDTEKHFVYVTVGGVTVILYEGMTLAIEVGGIPGTPFYTDPLDDPNQYNTGDGLGAGGWQISPISAHALDEVWVDASYNPNSCGGHTWGYDAFDKIQDGINAVSGSIVHVAAGTYYENIVLKDGVEVMGAGNVTTIIDGMQNGSAVSATNIGNAARLEAFTITNGSILGGFGAGMYNFNSSPVITNCTFRDNSAAAGGGICNHLGSSPVITNCTFRNNSASAGAGMFNYYGSSPVITSCTFENNSATGFINWGGALVNFENSSPVISSCILSHNSAILAGSIGNGNSSSPIITNCILFNNLASNGAGMMNIGNCSPIITNCTLWNNSASLNGSGIYNSDSSPLITNCIMWDNPPSEIYNEDILCTPIVTYSDIQGATLYPGTGNMNISPSFVNAPSDNFHLNVGSPCIGTGNNAAPFIPSTDFEGNPRICPAPGGTVDMGAYEVFP